MSTSWNEWQWLTTDAGRAALAELAESSEPVEKLVPRLRKRFSAAETHRLVEQADLRRRAGDKFTDASSWLFTPLGLEQSTDEWVARYKAARFPQGGPVVDLCCGIGGDLQALLRRGPTVGVDCDPLVAWLARHNTGAETQAAEASTWPVEQFRAWHIDPDRRPHAQRTTRVVDHEPGAEAIEALLARNESAAIKLAPAAEWPTDWDTRAEFEWISRRGQCRQLIAWFGDLARQRGQRVATLVDSSGQAAARIVGPADISSTEEAVPIAPAAQRWLYEPDAAVIAARLVSAVAMQYGLARLQPQIAYLTGETFVSSPALAAFEVLDEMAFDTERLVGWFREHGGRCFEVKLRGVEVDPRRVMRELSPFRGELRSVLLYPRGERIMAVVARRTENVT